MRTSQNTAESINTIGIDVGKNTFHLVGLGQARCDCSAAKGNPSSAWAPAQQYLALPDRNGNLFRDALYRTAACGAWSRCASDPSAVRETIPQGAPK